MFPDIRYGTERYPEAIARRLRTFNLTTWTASAVEGGFAFFQSFSPLPGMWRVAAVNACAALACAVMPLLHRVGPVAAPIGLIAFLFAYFAVVMSLLGIGTGMQNFYFVASALVFLFFGVERIVLASLVGVVAIICVIALEVLLPRDTGLLSEAELFFGNYVPSVILTCGIHMLIVSYALREAARAEALAEREHDRSERLLANILPATVAARLKTGAEPVIADRYDAASVMFADIEGYTALASDTPPDRLVIFLDGVFTEFDRLVERHGLEKIKTTGDCYMVVSGVPVPRDDHAKALASLALDLRDAAARLRDPSGRLVPMRIGISSGPVVAGVVGTRKFFYDVWGDAVNVAQRMEAAGVAGRIRVSRATWELLQHDFLFENCDEIEVKGKGRMQTWLLVGPNGQVPLNTCSK